MDLGQKGVFCFTDALNTAQLIELAQRTEQLGYSALWYPEALGYESFALGSFLLAHTTNLIIASGIANIYARDPTATRQGQHSLAKLYGGRFLLGLGVSHVPLVENARGHQYLQPVATMRAYLDSLDQAVAIAPPLDEPPRTVLAALGPRMTALAGARTAGAFPYNVTPEHTARARAVIGPEKWLCVEQKVLLVTDPAKARELARQAHHGAPTRLLDWSDGALIALHFAVRNTADDEHDAIVYVLEPDRLKDRLNALPDAEIAKSNWKTYVAARPALKADDDWEYAYLPGDTEEQAELGIPRVLYCWRFSILRAGSPLNAVASWCSGLSQPGSLTNSTNKKNFPYRNSR
jgi:probable F420-dependent oxidoreductase